MWGLFAVIAGYFIELILWKQLDPWLVNRPIEGRLFMLQVFLFPPLAWATRKFYYYPYYASPLRGLPGPRDHLFPAGQAVNQLRSGDPNEPYLSWVRRWPNADLIRYMGPFNSDTLVAVSIEAHVQIMKTNCYAFTKPGFYRRAIFPVTGRGLVFQDGEEHKRHRKIIASSFSSTNIRSMAPIFHRKAAELCTIIENDLTPGESDVVELVRRFSSTTLDVIGSAVLGVDLQSFQSVTPFHTLYRRAFEPSPWGLFLIAVNAIVPIRWINIGENRRFNANIASLHRLVRDVIRQRLREMNNQDIDGKDAKDDTRVEGQDLLTYIIKESRDAGERWTEDDLLGHILTLMAAGHETTSNALVWTIHLLTIHTEFQHRLREEIIGSLNGEAGEPDPGVLDRLPFLDKVFREVMRLYAPATHVTRMAMHDVEICGVIIPKGTPIMLLPAAINRNPRVWGRDCDSFNPDRWDKLEGEAAGPHAWATFFLGPRMCIGQEFVKKEFKYLLACMVSRFRFERFEEKPILLVNPSVVLRPNGGLRVRVFALKLGQ